MRTRIERQLDHRLMACESSTPDQLVAPPDVHANMAGRATPPTDRLSLEEAPHDRSHQGVRPGCDRGTSTITGVSDAQFELLRWFLVEVDDDTGFDSAAEVIARAMASIKRGRPPLAQWRHQQSSVATRSRTSAKVLGIERVRLADVPAFLRDLAPTWGSYRALTATQRLQQLILPRYL